MAGISFKIGWPVQLAAALLVLAGCAGEATPPSPTTAPELPLNREAPALAWTFEAGGPLNAPPLPAGEVVVVAPPGGPLLALNAADGSLRWAFDPPEGVWERAVAAAGGLVFAGLGGGNLAALDSRSGEVRWQKELGINAQMAPAAANGTLYVPTTFVGPGLKANPQGKARLFALSAAGGEELWAFETDNYILQTPFVQGDTVYVAGSYFDRSVEVDEGGPMRLYALNAADGSLRWAYESVDGFVKAIYATDAVVSYIAYQDFASGVDAATGQLRWRKDTGNWVPALSGAGETVYFGSANTVVHALNMADGETVWQYNIGGGSFNYALGAPAPVADDLYFMSQQGDIIALDARDGSLRWQLPTGIQSRVGVSVSGGRLFIGDAEGRVYAYK